MRFFAIYGWGWRMLQSDQIWVWFLVNHLCKTLSHDRHGGKHPGNSALSHLQLQAQSGLEEFGDVTTRGCHLSSHFVTHECSQS
jgi:hypothetical protein